MTSQTDSSLVDLMWDKVGIVRDALPLAEAGHQLGIAMNPVAFTRVKPGQTLLKDAA